MGRRRDDDYELTNHMLTRLCGHTNINYSMKDKLQGMFEKVHHLIRYFAVIGIIVFVGYAKQWNDTVFLIFIGPVIYLAQTAKAFVAGYVPVPDSQNASFYIFLMPLTIFYYGFIGFLFKQLWNERGMIKFVSLGALFVFLLYVHRFTFLRLTAYFTPIA